VLVEHSVYAKMASHALLVSGAKLVSELGLASESQQSRAESVTVANRREQRQPVPTDGLPDPSYIGPGDGESRDHALEQSIRARFGRRAQDACVGATQEAGDVLDVSREADIALEVEFAYERSNRLAVPVVTPGENEEA